MEETPKTPRPTVIYIQSEMQRQEVGIQELANRCKVPFSTISRIFNGEREPKIGTIEDIAAALGLKIDVKK